MEQVQFNRIMGFKYDCQLPGPWTRVTLMNTRLLSRELPAAELSVTYQQLCFVV